MNDDIDMCLIEIGKRLTEFLEQREEQIAKKHKDPKMVRYLNKTALNITGDFFFHSSFCLKKRGEQLDGDKYRWMCNGNKTFCCLRKCPKVLEGESMLKKNEEKSIKKLDK